MSDERIRIEIGVTTEAIDHVVEHVRDEERIDFERSYPTMNEGLLASTLISPRVFTAYVETEPIANRQITAPATLFDRVTFSLASA